MKKDEVTDFTAFVQMLVVVYDWIDLARCDATLNCDTKNVKAVLSTFKCLVWQKEWGIFEGIDGLAFINNRVSILFRVRGLPCTIYQT